MRNCIFNWSGGKDSALALYHCLRIPDINIRYLLTTVNDSAARISMHGVRTELLIKQSESIGIPLYQVRLPEMPGMAEYDAIMLETMKYFSALGITHAIYGDIFLQDLKNYRDARLAEAGMSGIYPLWNRNTSELISEFLNLGFGTVIACTQQRLQRFVGKQITEELIRSFPEDVDPCGENGEYHTFTFKGPIFNKEISYQTGEKVYREYTTPRNANDTCFSSVPDKPAGFWYCDLLPKP